MDYEYAPLVQQGWQCPICKRVYSPSTPMCWDCNSGESHTTITCTANPTEEIDLSVFSMTNPTNDLREQLRIARLQAAELKKINER